MDDEHGLVVVLFPMIEFQPEREVLLQGIPLPEEYPHSFGSVTERESQVAGRQKHLPSRGELGRQ